MISIFVLLLYAVLACSSWAAALISAGIALVFMILTIAVVLFSTMGADEKKRKTVKESLDKNCIFDKGNDYGDFYINKEKSILSVISAVGEVADIPDVHKSSSVLIECDYFLLDDIEKYLLHVAVSNKTSNPQPPS